MPLSASLRWKKLPEALRRYLDRRHRRFYGSYLASPGRILWTNLLAGAARGVGFALGVALLGAIVIPWLKRVDLSHIPVLGELAREVARLLEGRLLR